MNPYSVVITDLQLHAASQGSNDQYAWAYLLLSREAEHFATLEEPEIVFTNNPAREALRRLSAYQNCVAYTRLARMLNKLADQYDSRGRQ